MNTYQKGMRTVKKGRTLLESKGWKTADVETRSRFKKEDLFSLFDVMAIKPGKTKLIQFKTNSKPSMNKYIDFSRTYPQFEVEVWTWYDRKGWDITLVVSSKHLESK